MKAIILAAGRGSRMKGQTEGRPKCLVVLAGRTLLSLQMSALKQAGVTEVGIVTGYRGEMLHQSGVTVFENSRWSETNMVMSLFEADLWLSHDTCIVSYADIFYAAETVKRLMRAAGDLALTYDPDWLALWRSRFDDPLSDAESFALNDYGHITDIGRKVRNLSEVKGQYMGLLRFTPNVWGRVKDYLSGLESAMRDKMDMTSLLSAMIMRGEKIQAVPTYPGWGEIDSESDLAFYENEIACGRLSLADI